MAKKICAALIALFCLITLSIAADLPPENDESTAQVSLPLTEAERDSAVVNLPPLTRMVTLRPVNRRFDVRSKHPCRGRRHSRVYHALMRRENEEQIPYGDDMLVSSGENSDFVDNLQLNSDDRRFPLNSMHHHHHHHHEDSDSDSDDEDDHGERINKKMKVLNKWKNHFEHQNRDADPEKKESGFMKRVRKFLDHYF
ncbi:hypothetical protein ABFS82_01G063500 [Erythranthe guttata]|uniref:Uncharacterized protein n=1 Tax=Erythranthe guttata TaxID=4155 RepID=A0A022QA12_ERYGU|nr:PREDICTED: uncharacterized protein LOC105973749 [Erythranthe guttata]EYU23370.1 hypothetical protein MIMGU_mgv1a014210mg [Erythranthe guttata]|eukprot:XP_012854242.1 PREDICTED: uncharacterized protein LOC105973749 [Erythranthe guttata]